MQYVRFGAAFCWHPLSGIGVVVPQASSSGERTRSAPHASCGRTPHSECSNVIRSLDFFFAFPRFKRLNVRERTNANERKKRSAKRSNERSVAFGIV